MEVQGLSEVMSLLSAVDWLKICNFFHSFGLAWGLGGITVMLILLIKTERNPEMEPAFYKLIPPITKLIWFGTVFLIFSGIGLLFYTALPEDKTFVILKHLLVFWLVIVEIFVGTSFNKMLTYMNIEEKSSLKFLRAKTQFWIFSFIAVILWYLVTVLFLLFP